MAIKIGQGGIVGLLGDVAGAPVCHFDISNPSCYSGSGSTLTDLSGYGNTGTLVNSPTYNSSNGGYITLNGTNQYVSIADSASTNPGASAWSVSMWFTTGSLGTSGGPILYNKENLYEGSPGGGISQLAWQPNWAWVGSGSSLSLNTWYHTVHVYDLSRQYIYVDGVLVWSSALTGIIGTNTSPTGIGARGLPAANSFLTGSFAAFTMYNRALSPSEVVQNYNAAAPRLGKSVITQNTVNQNKGALISIATFTASGTYYVPSNCNKILVQLVGGGGGSAGYCESGGAGGYAEGQFTVIPGASYTVTVGGGGGAVGYYAAAGNGGTTSFGSLISATGGYGANQNYSHGGGHGGVGSGGQINLYGGSGTGHANSGGHSQAGPAGGGSFFGGSGSKSRGNNNSNNSPAVGSGAPGCISEIGNTGAVGASGLVIVHAYK